VGLAAAEVGLPGSSQRPPGGLLGLGSGLLHFRQHAFEKVAVVSSGIESAQQSQMIGNFRVEVHGVDYRLMGVLGIEHAASWGRLAILGRRAWLRGGRPSLHRCGVCQRVAGGRGLAFFW
jgi:hypothetical protein